MNVQAPAVELVNFVVGVVAAVCDAVFVIAGVFVRLPDLGVADLN